ncbi:MAG TPA: hypothetical protein VFK97_02245 [Candidatus Saccharimonadales bacterium]|nr:hypothetical protein [Candidatus Saccharimonadales bacterium]
MASLSEKLINMPNDEQNLVEPADGSLEAPAGQPAVNGGASAPPPLTPKKDSLINRLRRRTNIYLLVFVLLVLIVGTIVYITARSTGPSSISNVGSLTDQQLSALKGNTTLVGDAKQTLDVQSNSIFEGQILVRGDLNVAGGIKVGGSFSLASITISGAGNFGQLSISNGLNVGGDTVLQNSLTVQKNLSVGGSASFGNLSVSSLSVSSLQLQSDLALSRHIVTSGGSPSLTDGSALGSGGTASVSGSDTAGTVNINTGGSPPAGCFATLNFTHHFGATPHVIISPSNSSAASLEYYVNRTSSNFSVCTAGAPSGTTNYIFDYVIID